MSDAIIGILFAVFFLAFDIGFYVNTHINRKKWQRVLALDGKALFDEVINLIDRNRRAYIFKSSFPRQPDEYLSFFHYIYVPYHEAQHEKATRSIKWIILLALIGAGLFFFAIIGMYLLVEFTSDIESPYVLLLLGLLMAWACISAALVFWTVIKLHRDSTEAYREIDQKIIMLSGGTIPPPYWASLDDVMARTNLHNIDLFGGFGKK